MDRRTLIGVVVGSFVAAPLASFAQQQGKIWRVGFLSYNSVTPSLEADPLYGTFRKGMRDLGYIEGKNLTIELRTAEGRSERLPDIAAELVRLKLDLIVSAGTEATSAAQKATVAIPIVFVNASDPIASGFVESLARPGKNITGVTNMLGDLGPKHLEILLSAVPNLSRVAVLINRANSAHAAILASVQVAARNVAVKVIPVEARGAPDIENAFLVANNDNVGAVIVVADALFTQQRRQLAELAIKYRLPSISTFREFAEQGILITYGPRFDDAPRRAAVYADRIFKGAKPAELPVEQPTRFELVVNMKTAKALGIKIPQSIMLRADRVIE